MCPELCEGKIYDDKSDVWSFGCILFELMNLRPPFKAPNPIALAKKITNEPVPRMEKLPYSEELKDLCKMMLRKKPRLRPNLKHILSVISKNKVGP